MLIEAKIKDSTQESDDYYLSINSIDDKESWCNVYDDGLMGGIYSDRAIEEIVNHKFSEIPDNVQSIQFHVVNKSTWADDLTAELIVKDLYSTKAPAIKFEFGIEIEKWKKPINIIEYATILEDIPMRNVTSKVSSFKMMSS